MSRRNLLLAMAGFAIGLVDVNVMGSDLLAPGAVVEKLAGGFRFTEGPACDAEGNVFFSDIPNDRIHKWSVDGKLSTFRENSGGANGLYFDKKGNLIACEGKKRRLTSIDRDGAGDRAGPLQGKKLNSPNDLWIDPKGGVYFSDPRYGQDMEIEQEGFYVFYLPPGSKDLVRVIDDLQKPNGVVGTADGKLLYVADAGGGKTYVYKIQSGWELTDRKVIAPVGSDGMTLDEKGNLYLARNVVHVYSPEGTLVTTIDRPRGFQPTSFRRKGTQDLFITARTGLYALKLNRRAVDAGSRVAGVRFDRGATGEGPSRPVEAPNAPAAIGGRAAGDVQESPAPPPLGR